MRSTLKSFAVAAVALVAAFGAPGAVFAMTPPAPPHVTTLPVTDVTGTTATFRGMAVVYGTPTTAHFVYGTAPDQLTQSTAEVNLGAGPGEVPLTAGVTGLTPNTKYYVAAVVEDDDWVVDGDPVAFQTLAPPEILGGTIGDITFKSATLHLNVATHGQATTISGSVGRSLLRITRPGGRTAIRIVNGVPFGPIAVAADGDVAIPLAGLAPGVTYYWGATATSAVGADEEGGGPFQTPQLFALPVPEASAKIAPYGSHVTIKGATGGRAGLVVTLNAQAFPFRGPIAPIPGTTAIADAGGLYAFDVRAEKSMAYGVSADGTLPLDFRQVARVRVSAVVTAKLKRAKRHRFVVSGRYLPGTGVGGWASLFRRGAGRVGVAVAGHGGKFAFAARALRPGSYEVRFTPAPTSGYVVGKSAPFTVPRR